MSSEGVNSSSSEPSEIERYGVELHELAVELGIAEDVVFVGGVPNEETVNFYRAADLLVYPSFNETFGLPILEAMARACPVVTSNLSSMPEIAGGAAILADPHDPNSIGRSILEATGSEASRMRADGIRRAQQFTWGAVAAGTLDVYRDGGTATSVSLAGADLAESRKGLASSQFPGFSTNFWRHNHCRQGQGPQ